MALMASALLATASLDGAPGKKVAFIGNSYIYYNDLPRLMQAMTDDRGGGIGFTAHCVRGGASLPELIEKGSRGADAEFHAVSVQDLLLGNGGDGNTAPWDAVVMNDYSQASPRPSERAKTLTSLRDSYAPLLNQCGAQLVVLYVPPAYRAHVMGSASLGTWEEFTRLQGEGHAVYAHALEQALRECASKEQSESVGGGSKAPGSLMGGAVRDIVGGAETGDGAPKKRSGLSSAPPRVALADVNGAFARVRADRPALWERLFCEDDFHPSPSGSYLAALVILRALGVERGSLANGIANADKAGEAAAEGVVGKEAAAQFFKHARLPLGMGQPAGGSLPSSGDMGYLCSVAFGDSLL
mmetsp:Transcript_29319/g.59976  ORF Transcript_29319/g.59976 Transcript_29319/m.59976 type:complete len:356 (-) Transcript_29319:118-1185(-)